MNNTISIRAIATKQGNNTEIYSFFLRAKDLLRIADISRIKRDEDGSLQGLQRSEIKKHVNDILEYLNGNEVLFPNSIILAINNDVKTTKARGPKIDSDKYCQAVVLDIPLDQEPKPGWIVDGQQRVLALSKCDKPDLPVPVTAFIAKDLELQREQFIRVNKTKPLPKGLIDELLPTVTSILPADLSARMIPSRISEYLTFDARSPFYGLIKKISTETDNRYSPVVAHNSIVEMVKASINTPSGALYPYLAVNNNETDYQSILKTLFVFWGAVKKVFQEDWGRPPHESRLMHGAGISALGSLMDIIMRHANLNDKKLEFRIIKELEKIKPLCNWSSGKWHELDIEWNMLQNTSTHKKKLTNYIIRAYHAQSMHQGNI